MTARPGLDWHLVWWARAFVIWHRGRFCPHCTGRGCPELAWACGKAAEADLLDLSTGATLHVLGAGRGPSR